MHTFIDKVVLGVNKTTERERERENEREPLAHFFVDSDTDRQLSVFCKLKRSL